MAKHIITFKSPDAIDNSMHGESQEARNEVKKILSPFTRYGEYVDLCVDTETKTVTLLKSPRSQR